MSLNLKHIRDTTRKNRYERLVQIFVSGIVILFYLMGMVMFYKTCMQHKRSVSSIGIANGPVVVIYNKVPHSGSTNMVQLLRKLAIRNGFNLEVSGNPDNELMTEEIETFYARVLSKIYPLNWNYFQNSLIVRNFFFVPFGELKQKVLYINLVRDPLHRFVSAFYATRKHFKSCLDEEFFSLTPEYFNYLKTRVKEEWLNKNVLNCPLTPLNLEKLAEASKHPESLIDHTCLAPKSKYIICDPSVIESLRNDSNSWFERSLEDCVLENDKECLNDAGKKEYRSSKQNVLINRLAGPENILNDANPQMKPPCYTTGPIPYFCGIRVVRDERALYNYTIEAISNLNQSYSVVAILEKMEMSLSVLEYKFPTFFGGALIEYEMMMNEKKQKHADKKLYVLPSQKIINVLKGRLNDEYALYDYATKRLEKQFNQIKNELIHKRNY